MTRLYNKRKSYTRRKCLRNNMARAEKVLWKNIRERRIGGIKFRRQFSVGGFILDFYSPNIKLAIEVDGDYHLEPGQMEYDKMRQGILEGIGIKFLRFSNDDVLLNCEKVLGKISSVVNRIRPVRSNTLPLAKGERRRGGLELGHGH